MLWTDEAVDVVGDFIANYPLYQRLNLKDFLREQDPDDLDHMDESEEPPVYKAETVIKYCLNERCKAERPYRRTSFTSGLGGQHHSPRRTRIRSMVYSCTYCGSAFWCWIEISKRFADGDKWIRKIGQLPPYDISIERSLEKALKEDAVLYKRAQICIGQSFGIAACVYLRRLLEEQVAPLLWLVYEARKQEGEDVSGFAEIMEEKVAENKIRLANKVLPTSAAVEGDNPLELIYDRLSAGLHRQSEDECIEIAREASQVLQHVIVSINDEYQQRQSKNRYVELIRKMRGRDK